MTTPAVLQSQLAQAFAFHKAGDFAQAEPLYQQILKAAPKHFDTLHMLGVVYLQTGRPEEALRLIGKAIDINPKAPIALNNHGNVLQALKRHAEALRSYSRAVALKADYDEALKNQGDMLQALERPEDALACYDKALNINARHAEVYNNRGVSLQSLSRLADALASFERAVALKPDYAAAFSNRADTLHLAGRYEDALASYDQALAIEPRLVEALTNRGNVLRKLGRGDAALASYDEALAVAPAHVKALNNRGAILRDLSRYDDALASFDQALTHHPEYLEAYVNRGTTLHDMGRGHDALESFNRALALNPTYADAHWNGALASLTLGDFAAGWAGYEWRWQCKDFSFPPRGFAQPPWRGEDVADGSVLVWGEQGIGDEVLYAGMVGDLIDRKIPLIWEADARLLPLIARSYPGVKTVARKTPADAATADPAIKAQTSTASLGQYLRPNLGTFPKGRRSYLKADPRRSAAYRERLLGGSQTRLIGLSWVSKNPDFGIHKTMALSTLKPVFEAAGPATRFVDLQYGDTASERSQAGFDLAHLEDLDLFQDIDGLAALLGACDLVITVSNTTAHLAGALGVPVWVMVPAGNGKLWYWGADGKGSPWYPSASVFKQQSPGDWETLANLLANQISAKS